MTATRRKNLGLWALGAACLVWSAAANAQPNPGDTAGSVCAAGDRYERGLERLNQVTQGQGQVVVDALSPTSPDLPRYIIEYAYGDIFCRPVLTDQQRQLAIIAAVAAMGYAAPELRVHVHGALNVGVTEQEVVETMILMSVYAGFPAAIHGLRAAQDVFDARAAQ